LSQGGRTFFSAGVEGLASGFLERFAVFTRFLRASQTAPA